MSLVYALVAKSNPAEMRYIGRTHNTNPAKRRREHLNEAAKGVGGHKCNLIRKLLREGDEVLAIIVESDLSWDESGIKETFYIDHYKALGHRLTNATLGGDGALGWVPSLETRAKMGAANIGKTRTDEAKAKNRMAHTGKKHSNETKAKIGTTSAGRKHTEGTKEKMSAVHLGKKHTSEHIAKNRASHVGKTHTDETKAKIGVGNTGKKRSDEAKAKMSAAHAGKLWTEERRVAATRRRTGANT